MKPSSLDLGQATTPMAGIMKLIHALTALTAVCFMLAGCVSTGVDIRPEQLSNFLLGFSTIDDVTNQLGTPSSQVTLKTGSTILVYSFATSHPHAESFIPFIGPLFSGGEIRSSTVLLEFDENGILRSERRTTSSGTSGLTVLPATAM